MRPQTLQNEATSVPDLTQQAIQAVDKASQLETNVALCSSTTITPSPHVIDVAEQPGYWDITLLETITIALQNSEVLRDLGGRIVSQPGNTASQYNPILTSNDPRTGVDAALSNFDVQLRWTNEWRRNNRGLKLPPFGSNNTEILQDLVTQRSAISKLYRTGTTLELQQGLDFDRDDLGVPPNRFASVYTPFVGMELRHPLALGGGRLFNEVAGPNAAPGVFYGILIAQIKADIASDEYQLALRDFVFNTVRIYWLLQFAYERLDIEQQKLDASRRLYEVVKRKEASGLSDPDEVDIAREQVLAAEFAVQSSYYGAPERLLSGILGPNGALLAGSELGLLSLERRLRFLMGLPVSQHRFLRPIDDPISAPIVLDWNETISSAISRRPELVRQEKVINQKRWELAAAKTRLLPTLDFVGQARLLGFGDDLIGSASIPQDSALAELAKAAQQEVSAAMEFRWPVGNRIGHTSVQNALLSLRREVAIQNQQQLQISHEVASAIEELNRVQQALSINEQRKLLAESRRRNIATEFDQGMPVPIEQVINAEITEIEAKTNFLLAKADYQVALAALSLARGMLLSDLSVHFAEANDVSLCEPTTVTNSTATMDAPFNPTALAPIANHSSAPVMPPVEPPTKQDFSTASRVILLTPTTR